MCSAHVSVDMNARDAPNYGGRVPVDTTPGPAPVCRALKINPSAHHQDDELPQSTPQLRHDRGVNTTTRCGPQGSKSTFTEKSGEIQIQSRQTQCMYSQRPKLSAEYGDNHEVVSQRNELHQKLHRLTQCMYPLSNQKVLKTGIIPEDISQKIQLLYSPGETEQVTTKYEGS